MENFIERMQSKYNYLMYEATYPWSRSWSLVSSPVPVVAVLVSYYCFCTRLGPLLMRGRRPFQLKHTLLSYNICQVAMSLHIFYYLVIYVSSGDYDWFCMPIDYSKRPSALWMVRAAWWYCFSKLTELLDTVFFVLRKKERQISTLHVYHHMLMVVISWIGVKYAPGGQATLMALMNSFIHVLVYSYYLISGLGPQYQRYLWWKKHLTTLQLIQFVIIGVHNACAIFADCSYPKTFNVIMVFNSLVFVYMFGDFYYQNYVRSEKLAPESHFNGTVYKNN